MKKMEIKQINYSSVFLDKQESFVLIQQDTDGVFIEKQSIPALIDALKKFVE